MLEVRSLYPLNFVVEQPATPGETATRTVNVTSATPKCPELYMRADTLAQRSHWQVMCDSDYLPGGVPGIAASSLEKLVVQNERDIDRVISAVAKSNPAIEDKIRQSAEAMMHENVYKSDELDEDKPLVVHFSRTGASRAEPCSRVRRERRRCCDSDGGGRAGGGD